MRDGGTWTLLASYTRHYRNIVLPRSANEGLCVAAEPRMVLNVSVSYQIAAVDGQNCTSQLACA
jgi:hypothetical protein